MLNFPLISANVYRSNGKLLLTPVYYANIGGERFAFLGFVTQETSILTHAKNVAGLEFKDPVALAQELVPKLKQKVDHVIVVSHVGIQVDRKIAKSVKGIDVIIGGHTQVPLWAPEFINGTFIVQDWEYGKTLGRLDMFYFDKELVAFEGGLLRYDPKITADKKMSQLVDKVSNKVDQVMNEVIAKTAVDLEGKRSIVRTQETNLGNLVADILLERAQKIKGHAADIMLTNSGGIRTRIAAGDISKKDLFNLMPFPNTLVIVEVSGKDLLAALENGVSRINDEEPAGRFPQVAGMSFAFDKSKPASKRIVWAKVKGEPVRDQQIYKLATSDFLAGGGDGYATLKKPHYDTGLTIYAILEEAIMARRVLNPQVEGRIVQIK
jgi:5'-nucleotidase